MLGTSNDIEDKPAHEWAAKPERSNTLAIRVEGPPAPELPPEKPVEKPAEKPAEKPPEPTPNP